MVTLTAGNRCRWLNTSYGNLGCFLPVRRNKHLKNVFLWYLYFLGNGGCLYDSHSCFSLVIFLKAENSRWLSAKSATFLPSYPEGSFSQVWMTVGAGNGSSPFRNISHMWKLKLGRFEEAHKPIFCGNTMYMGKQTKNPARTRVPFSPSTRVSLQLRSELNKTT